MILKNQQCFASLFTSLLNRTNGMSYKGLLSLSIQQLIISLWVHSLLPLLLFLFDIRLLPEEHKDVDVFTTDAVLQTATCSWSFTVSLEFPSMFLCKISFSSSSHACLPFSVLKENKR